ncbi:subtilisin-like serine protease [Amycolatopsis mediterranei S699]|uniref:Subtilisin-like serine protease n=2 Tax=Amycolatopsis mediterranei TaxID=33910 RepID=A0A0H3CZ03_AMYMU|nr:S8/S53 family peptidase [Amycolatopsis mediterranei]ADJ43174.1 subtilisin-like serine protease [Amycolatopsis mediterranei U32]AEK39872.1 subtilisin-like serine protease [Amycolatopsis mediterranei S699]AFO74889.1 subtilisin-like serine protease [Amycolatopsis mediterranei S699]AGT82018.1 subtilisin-like serine protease [Amycolatopsis mediterranei RB]KDO05085.1 serine protease [Amycolatopsis mediterranei]
MTRYRHRAGELLVHADDSAAIHAELAGFGYHPDGGTGPLRRFTGTRPVPEVLAALRGHGASPNHLFGLDRIIWNVLEAKATEELLFPLPGEQRAEFEVGVVDTGVVLRNGEPHEYLGTRVRYDPEDTARIVRDAAGNPVGSGGHGTFVAGVILKEVPATVAVRMKGVVDESTGDVEDLAVANAIDDLAGRGIRLINLSFSGATWEDEPPKAIEQALRRLPPDAVVVTAAGNRGSRQRVFPAAISLEPRRDEPAEPKFAKVIAVGAVETTAGAAPEIAGFSNYGPWVTAYADGVDVVGPYFHGDFPNQTADGEPRFNGYAVWSGTSFAAATVTGRIAAKMAANRGMTARRAAEDVLDNSSKVTYWDVNGQQERPFVASMPA